MSNRGYWEYSGFLKGLSDSEKDELSEVLDDVVNSIRMDATGVYLPLVRRLWNLGKRNFNHETLYQDFLKEWKMDDPNTYYTYNDLDIEMDIFNNIIERNKDRWLNEK